MRPATHLPTDHDTKDDTMKEFEAIASNVILAPQNNGTLRALMEMSFIYSEPEYERDEAKGFIRSRVVGQFRICMNSDALRLLASGALEHAEQLDAAVDYFKPALAAHDARCEQAEAINNVITTALPGFERGRDAVDDVTRALGEVRQRATDSALSDLWARESAQTEAGR